MNPVQLFAVTADGPLTLSVAGPLQSIHDLPEDLPLGVYTAFRTFEHNKFLCLEDHFARLEQSMSVLGWDFTLDRLLLRQALDEVCSAYPLPDARVRLDILAEAIAVNDDNRQSRLLLTLAPFTPVPPRYYEEGVRLALAPRLHRTRPQAKTADFVLARRDYPLGQPDAYDYLLLDAQGHLLEGSSSNFYAVKQGVIWTAGEEILEGITRKILLKLVREREIPLRLQAVTVAEIEQLEEAFLSSSSRGVLPVVQIDGRVVGQGRPGPVTRQLMAAYREFVEQAIQPAIPQ